MPGLELGVNRPRRAPATNRRQQLRCRAGHRCMHPLDRRDTAVRISAILDPAVTGSHLLLYESMVEVESS